MRVWSGARFSSQSPSVLIEGGAFHHELGAPALSRRPGAPEAAASLLTPLPPPRESVQRVLKLLTLQLEDKPH